MVIRRRYIAHCGGELHQDVGHEGEYRNHFAVPTALIFGSQTGICTRVLEAHTEVVTSLAWLPDGTGFISGGLDRKIILWVRTQQLGSARGSLWAEILPLRI